MRRVSNGAGVRTRRLRTVYCRKVWARVPFVGTAAVLIVRFGAANEMRFFDGSTRQEGRRYEELATRLKKEYPGANTKNVRQFMKWALANASSGARLGKGFKSGSSDGCVVTCGSPRAILLFLLSQTQRLARGGHAPRCRAGRRACSCEWTRF